MTHRVGSPVRLRTRTVRRALSRSGQDVNATVGQRGAVENQQAEAVAPNAFDLESAIAIARPGVRAARPDHVVVPIGCRDLGGIDFAGGEHRVQVDPGLDHADPTEPDGHAGDRTALGIEHPAVNRHVVAHQPQRCLTAVGQRSSLDPGQPKPRRRGRDRRLVPGWLIAIRPVARGLVELELEPPVRCYTPPRDPSGLREPGISVSSRN